MQNLPSLYFIDTNENLRIWTVFIDNDTYWVEHGVVGGKIQKTKPKIGKPKNVGKKNETTGPQQALNEATRLWEEQVHDGMVQNKEAARPMVDSGDWFKPMLAQTYNEGDDLDYTDLYVQPKLDGFRLIHQRNVALSRSGKPFNTVDHISKALVPFFQKYPNAILDGELYNHTYCDKFQDLQSLISKKNLSLDELCIVENTIKYYVYDACFINGDEKQPFWDRYCALRDALKDIPYIEIVPTYAITDKVRLDMLYDAFLEQGYEGQMIRYNAKYENKRCKSLLKRKTFKDSEYLILDISEGRGNMAGMAGNMTLALTDGTEFNSNIKATIERRKNLLDNKHVFIGKYATVKYFSLSETKIPRFPYVMKIREADGSEIPF